jgi:hypothetical protein
LGKIGDLHVQECLEIFKPNAFYLHVILLTRLNNGPCSRNTL